jgi:hypothetical protein
VIERINRELTQRGAQRLPSTFGTGTQDTRRAKPAEQAIRYRVRLTELIAIINGVVREYNETSNEGLQYSSPLAAAKYAMERRDGGWFPQPLPHGERADLRLLMHIETVTVLGNEKTYTRPYVNISRDIRRCERLSNNYTYVGKQLICYIDRRDPRNVKATVAGTGEDLGALHGTKKWSRYAITWRERLFLIRGGMAKRYAVSGVDAVTKWTEEKKAEMTERARRKGTKTKVFQDGLQLARFEQARSAATDAAPARDDAVVSSVPVAKAQPSVVRPRNPFGLDTPVKLSLVKRGAQ